MLCIEKDFELCPVNHHHHQPLQQKTNYPIVFQDTAAAADVGITPLCTIITVICIQALNRFNTLLTKYKIILFMCMTRSLPAFDVIKFLDKKTYILYTILVLTLLYRSMYCFIYYYNM